MIVPSDFGSFLKQKRMDAKLTQMDLANTIHKTVQYISNIETGKNNAPPVEADIEALVKKLALSGKEEQLFREKAAADRRRLPNEQMDYLLRHRKLLDLIYFGSENNISDKRWAEILNQISGGEAK